MTTKEIFIKGAKENNLRNIDVHIPRDKMIVLTGLSGSGKTSLAFDTIYAEGQRRYVESLSAYARQFLGRMDKPNVEFIEGLSPAISIDQKTTSNNPRSTVGTVTEINDYLRLLFARIGVPHCPVCGREISSQSVDQIVDHIMEMKDGTRIKVIAPVIQERKGEHVKLLERLKREGFNRVIVDGEEYLLGEDEIKLEKNFKHTIEIVTDRIVVSEGQEGRIAEAVEISIAHGNGLVVVEEVPRRSAQDNKEESQQADGNKNNGNNRRTFSTKFACPVHGVSLEDMEPRSFSFNSPFGACPTCNGLGFIQSIIPEKLLDYKKSIPGGALGRVYASMEFSGFYRQEVEALAEMYGVDIDLPLEKLPAKFMKALLYGTGNKHLKYTYISRRSGRRSQMDHPFEGVINNLERRYRETASDFMQERIQQYMTNKPCPDCHGARLKPEILAVTVGNKSISQISDMSVTDAYDFFESLDLNEKESMIGFQILKEIKERLKFLIDVGLSYLTLSRSAGTLSGGESQRIRLATQIGSGLMGVLYILDEPSIGLHQKDNAKLLKTLRRLTDMGNTLLVVEHDEDTMYAADQIIDIGPGAGVNGGKLVAQGTVEEIKKNPESITGQYLSGAKKISVPKHRREGNGKKIQIKGAAENNLQNVNVDIPLGKFVCVTGVSGSGKSSLINEVLYKTVAHRLNGAAEEGGAVKAIKGLEHIDKVIDIDQSPIGRTPRSNPATYTGMFTPIRELFAALPEAKLRGYEKGRFSFNVKGGRCEACKGDGIIKIEMHFLPDVYVPCEVCKGKRFNRETLEVKYKGKNIYEVLDMTVAEALEFFKSIPTVMRQLETLNRVGLDYIRLGQPSTQLSGGEAQRVKLASELSKRQTGRTLYILDEPTTGLHFADVHKLIHVLEALVEAGNTVVVIEHNLDVIKRADHIIDMGPDGGTGGGRVIAEGTPEEVAKIKGSYTGEFLKKML
ncbi:excinuclease ABC subunit A [Clostridiales bacterium S5-A14a]|nr:excinuclease ABC subunit A [Clostridiales bacterium S5-A14a]